MGMNNLKWKEVSETWSNWKKCDIFLNSEKKTIKVDTYYGLKKASDCWAAFAPGDQTSITTLHLIKWPYDGEDPLLKFIPVDNSSEKKN